MVWVKFLRRNKALEATEETSNQGEKCQRVHRKCPPRRVWVSCAFPNAPQQDAGRNQTAKEVKQVCSKMGVREAGGMKREGGGVERSNGGG